MNGREAGSDHGHPRRLLGGSWPRPVAAEGQASLSCPALSPRNPSIISLIISSSFPSQQGTCHLPRDRGAVCVQRGRLCLRCTQRPNRGYDQSHRGRQEPTRRSQCGPRLRMRRQGGCWMRRKERHLYYKHLKLPLKFIRNSSLRLCGIGVLGARAEGLCQKDLSSPPDEV